MRALVVSMVLSLAACAETGSAREATVVSTMARADDAIVRARPGLAAGKYARMARSLYDFYRGEVPIFRGDLTDARLPIAHTRFPAEGPLPISVGDPHPENFGVLVSADGSMGLESNDLDAADRLPYHWELRRLTVGLVLATRLSNADDDAARAAAIAAEGDVVRACATAYADRTHAFATGAPIERVTTDGGSTVIAQLFEKSMTDRATTLDELTELTTGSDGAMVRRLRRGALDPTQPEQVFVELSDEARAALPAVLETARSHMSSPPDPAFFSVLDAVRELGSGVASWPRVRAIVLVRGPSDAVDDDVTLELKEEGDAASPAVYPPFRTVDDIGARIDLARQRVWSRPDADPLWANGGTWLGMPVQVRSESNGNVTLRVSRLHGTRGTPGALVDMARVLGGLLARITARDVDGTLAPARAIDAAIQRDPSGFVEDEVRVALDEADRVQTDWATFREGLDRVGLDLGVRVEPSERPSAALEALFCVPVTAAGCDATCCIPPVESYR
jgi:uncharacterized protein (DUF2252 family)